MKVHIVNTKTKCFVPIVFIGLTVISPQVFSSEPVDLFSVTGFVEDSLANSVLTTEDQTDINDPSSIIGGIRNIYTDIKTNTYGSPNSASSIDINYDLLLQLNKLSFSNDDGIGGEGGIQWNGLLGLQDLGTAGDIYKLGENLRAKGDLFAYSILTLDQTNSSPFVVSIEAYTNNLKYTKVLVESSAVGDYTIPFDNLEDASKCGYVRPIGDTSPIISVECGSSNSTPVDMHDVGALQVILNKDGLTTTVDMSIGPITILDRDIQIEKYTNGNNADGANDGDVPIIVPGDTVTWTYHVTNTGDLPIDRAEIVVTDSQPGVNPEYVIPALGGLLPADNGDDVLSPGEVWVYTASLPAENLKSPTSSGITIVEGCDPNTATSENHIVFHNVMYSCRGLVIMG